MLVSNAEVFTSRIVDNTADPIRRGSVGVWLGYDADPKGGGGGDRHRDPRRARRAPRAPARDPPRRSRRRRPARRGDLLTDWRRADFKNTNSAVCEAILDAFKAARIPLRIPTYALLRHVNELRRQSQLRDLFVYREGQYKKKRRNDHRRPEQQLGNFDKCAREPPKPSNASTTPRPRSQLTKPERPIAHVDNSSCHGKFTAAAAMAQCPASSAFCIIIPGNGLHTAQSDAPKLRGGVDATTRSSLLNNRGT